MLEVEKLNMSAFGKVVNVMENMAFQVSRKSVGMCRLVDHSPKK